MTYSVCRLVFILSAITLLSACASTAKSPQDQRLAIQKTKDETLTKLYELYPKTRSQISAAPGYAVFTNASVNVILASFGGGYGMVQNNATGKITYMKMTEIGVGLGAGVKDFRVVMVFDSKNTMDQFIDHGWVFGAQADAAAKASDQGAAVGGEVTVNGIKIYQFTESGLALQATVKGTKFWKDARLNE